MDENKGGITLQRKHIVIIAAIFAALLVGGIVIGMNFGKWFGDKDSSGSSQSQDQAQSKTAIDLDPNAGEWTGSKPEDKTGGKQSGIKVPGYPSITVAKDTPNVRMALLNPEGNPCYFKFRIVLKDTGEQIYESKYVEPGKAITDVELTRGLPEGEYKATIMISTLSLDGATPLNGANVETVLIAK